MHIVVFDSSEGVRFTLESERAKVNRIDCRFCQKCTKFHELSAFMKDKRACIASLNKLAKIRSKTTTKKGIDGQNLKELRASSKRENENERSSSA